MSKKTHSQDSNSEEFEKIWKEMEELEPLTPVQDAQKAYRQAATFDHMIFGDYDCYEAYKAED